MEINKLKKTISILLFLAGLLLLVQPQIERHVDLKNEKQLLQNFEEIQAMKSKEPQEMENVVGILEIPVIQFKQVILAGASSENLEASVALMEESASFETLGRQYIAGHNSHTYGWQFNRLEELKISDKIHIHLPRQKRNYQVIKRYIVAEDEIGILADTEVDSKILLITCIEVNAKKKRLIIEAEKI